MGIWSNNLHFTVDRDGIVHLTSDWKVEPSHTPTDAKEVLRHFVNPYAKPLPASEPTRPRYDRVSLPRVQISGWRSSACMLLIVTGVILGLSALVLLSNRFGNTDIIGLGLLGVAGWSFGTGVAYLRARFSIAALIGVFVAPLTVFALFLIFWLWLILVAVANASR